MTLLRGLIILVKDWQEKLENEETTVRMEEVMQTVGGEMWKGWMPQLTPGQIADLIVDDLEEVGSLDSAYRTIEPYPTKEALLKELDLLSLMQDLGI